MAFYELLIIGSPTKSQIAALNLRTKEVADQFELTMSVDIVVRTAADAGSREPKSSAVALYFGGSPTTDAKLVDDLELAKIPIVPVVLSGSKVEDAIPDAIRSTNVCFIESTDIKLEALAAVAFECLGLLRQQRRVFVSYRRVDSREVALQLHDQLSSRGFDVFLDTHDIRPGEPFQEMLWHRLSDCDVVIMLDTQDYFNSKWTKQELGRSLAKGIHILRIIWPGHKSSRHLNLSETIRLAKLDFNATNLLTEAKIDEVIRRTENLRSRSIATRHREIAGKLLVEVDRVGGKFEGIGAYRAISLSLPYGTKVWAYPVVGVPTAELLNDVHKKATSAEQDGILCLVYDHIGIREAWLAHLAWLDTHIAAVRALKVMDAGWELVKWDS